MKIDEAIEILEQCIPPSGYNMAHNDAKAVQLGIEALKRERKSRQGTFSIPLPGETD